MRRPLEPRPSILDDVPDEGHVVLEASAGTGKTYTLEHLVLRLVLEGSVELEELLVVTFTEKATEELRSRLRARLLDLAAADADALEAAGWSLGPEQRRRLEETLARVDELHVSTIHGFCQGLLHDLAFRHHRLFQQELVDGDRLLRESFREVFRRTLGDGTRLGAATEQILREGKRVQALEDLGTRAAGFRHGPVTPRWDPEGLPDLVAAAAGALGDPEWRFLKGSEWAANRAAMLSGIADPADPLEVSGTWLEDADENGPEAAFRAALDAHASDEARALLAALDELDLRAGDPEALVASGFRESVLAEARDRKAARGWYDFDDMLELVAEGLRRPDGDVRRAVRDRYRCALIDEFQDTDPVQWEIFRRLFPPGDPEHRLVLIGDPKQSIYGFRNADLAVYQRARDAIAAGGGSLHALTENFRSTPRMLAAHDLLFDGFFDEGIDYHPSRAGRPDLRLVADEEDSPPPVVALRPFREGRGRALSHSRVRDAVLEEAAREIRRIVEDGALRIADGERSTPIRYRDVQILARSNNEVRIAAETLHRAAIPFTLYRQEGLFQTDAAGHVLDLLRAIARPGDRKARLRAWLTPFFGVPLDRIPDAREAPGDHPVRALLHRWQRQAESGDLPSLFRSLLRDSGLARRLLFAEDGARELTDYEHVLEILAREARRGARTLAELAGLLHDYREERSQPPGLDGNVQRLEGDRDAVQLLTMHKAKGLEATVVFLVGGLWGARPGPGDANTYRTEDARCAHLGRARGEILRRIEEEQRREDQRLLYVAVTRARARLYLAWPGPAGKTERGVFGTQAIRGTYQALDERLTELLADPDPTTADLFRVRELPYDPSDGDGRETAVEEDPGLDLLDRETLAASLAAGDDAMAALRRSRAGILITSYSRLARHGAASWGAEDQAPPDLADEIDDAGDSPADDALPGGVATGLALHEILEHVDFGPVRSAFDLDAWRQDRVAAEVVARAARRHGLEHRHRPRLQELVWNALRTPIVLDGIRLREGLAAVERRTAEMEFLYPIPEADHPGLGSAPDPAAPLPFRVRRGYLQGVVDLLFEHEGRIYFLDWKSDRRADWSSRALVEHVERHYALQRQLYTLALLRAVDLGKRERFERRFGGLLYCFLRGMGRSGEGLEGVVFERPSWDEVGAWERGLRRRRYPGAAEVSP